MNNSNVSFQSYLQETFTDALLSGKRWCNLSNSDLELIKIVTGYNLIAGAHSVQEAQTQAQKILDESKKPNANYSKNRTIVAQFVLKFKPH